MTGCALVVVVVVVVVNPPIMPPMPYPYGAAAAQPQPLVPRSCAFAASNWALSSTPDAFSCAWKERMRDGAYVHMWGMGPADSTVVTGVVENARRGWGSVMGISIGISDGDQ